MVWKTLAAVTLVTGCSLAPTSPTGDDDVESPMGEQPGSTPPRMIVRLTDAPAAFEAVWVDISRVEIESSADGWSTLVNEPQRFDLLTLRDGVTAAMGDAELAAGHYGQLRLIVDSASVVVGGIESPMTIASGAQTGVKIPLDRDLEANMTYTLTLDYDAEKSVKSTGQGYLMTPVVHVKEMVGTPAQPEPEAPEPEQPAPDAGEPDSGEPDAGEPDAPPIL